MSVAKDFLSFPFSYFFVDFVAKKYRRQAPAFSGQYTRLHVRIVRTTAAFRRYPGDVLGRILDVTGLAVDTVLGVDLELLAAAVFRFNHFVHEIGRAHV